MDILKTFWKHIFFFATEPRSPVCLVKSQKVGSKYPTLKQPDKPRKLRKNIEYKEKIIGSGVFKVKRSLCMGGVLQSNIFAK